MDEGRRLMLELLGELKAERERAERAEAALRTLVEAASRFVDGYRLIDDAGVYECCLEASHHGPGHAEGCPYVATQKALAQARAALPGGAAEGGE